MLLGAEKEKRKEKEMWHQPCLKLYQGHITVGSTNFCWSNFVSIFFTNPGIMYFFASALLCPLVSTCKFTSKFLFTQFINVRSFCVMTGQLSNFYLPKSARLN
uniref:Uncharacterized protein n=1 Tax=Oryza brachyantha TaxID=4533 RepID=J3NDF8_ORYBR